MCSGSDILNPIKSLFGGGGGGGFNIKDRIAKLGPAPTPDDLRASTETQAAQDAARQTLELRRRMRRNSLLSMAGGAGDLSQPTLATASAVGKTDLGG